MNLEFFLSILGVVTSIIAAIYSWIKVLNKKKAEDSFVELIRHEVAPDQQRKIEDLIISLKERETIETGKLAKYLLEEDKQKYFETYFQNWQKLEEIQKEILALTEKLASEQKQLIIESVNQPSKKGQLAYLEKIFEKVSPDEIFEPQK